MRYLAISIAFLLGFKKQLSTYIANIEFLNSALKLYQIFNLLQKPVVDLGLLLNRFKRNTQLDGIVNMKQAIPTRMLQRFQQGILIAHLSSICSKSVSLYFKRLTSFLKGFLKRTTNSHHLTNRLHLQSQLTIRSWEFIEVPTWNLHNNIVQSRLKHRRCRLGNLVRQLVEVIPNGQLRCNFCNRISGSFRR